MALYKLVCGHAAGKRHLGRAWDGRSVAHVPRTATESSCRERESRMSSADGPLVVGVDSSTQSTKALVVDAATGAVVASGQAPHTVSAGQGRESDPEEWWTALCEALRQCGEAAHRASAVSVGGQQHGLVTLDAAGLLGTSRAALERRALGTPGPPPHRRDGRSQGVGRAGGQRARGLVHRHEVGVAGRARAGRGTRHGRGTAAARLPHAAADRRRHDGPGRRLGHGLVGIGHRVVRRRHPGARGPRSGAAAPGRTPRGGGRHSPRLG